MAIRRKSNISRSKSKSALVKVSQIVYSPVKTWHDCLKRYDHPACSYHFPGTVTRTPAREYRSAPTCLIVLELGIPGYGYLPVRPLPAYGSGPVPRVSVSIQLRNVWKSRETMMAYGGNRFPQILSVFAIVIFRGVTSNIDDGNFDRKNFNGYDALYRPSHDQFSESYNAPLHPVENRFWRSPENFGEISGVAVEPTGNLVIFHLGDRMWNYDTFNENAEYQEKYRGPIYENTVLTLNPKTGDIIYGWGNQTFYLPHGIHVYPFGNIWLTDIALHQVFKYSASGVPQLVLGQRFEPGSDIEHFCHPTSVAVLPSGEIVVADG